MACDYAVASVLLKHKVSGTHSIGRSIDWIYDWYLLFVDAKIIARVLHKHIILDKTARI